MSLLLLIRSHAFIAIATGVLTHRALFINGEWHRASGAIVLSHIFSSFMLYGLWSQVDRSNSLHLTLHDSALYLLGLFTSMTLYRCFFHRLNRFPGPFGARVSKLWHVYHTIDAKNHLLLARLRQRYGEVFRIGKRKQWAQSTQKEMFDSLATVLRCLGPNELVVIHPDAHKVIDGVGSSCEKSDWYDVIQPSESVLFTRDNNMHHKRRNVWLRAMNINGKAKRPGVAASF